MVHACSESHSVVIIHHPDAEGSMQLSLCRSAMIVQPRSSPCQRLPRRNSSTAFPKSSSSGSND